MAQNLEGVRPLAIKSHPWESLVQVYSVYTKQTARGTLPYMNGLNPITGQTYNGVEIIGPVPGSGQRGVIMRLEGDPNSLVCLTIDQPTVEHYVPLLTGVQTLTASGVPAGVVAYPVPGTVSVAWAWEVVGMGTGSVTLADTTVTLTAEWARQRVALPSLAPGTLLTPSVTVTGAALSLSLIALVGQSWEVTSA